MHPLDTPLRTAREGGGTSIRESGHWPVAGPFPRSADSRGGFTCTTACPVPRCTPRPQARSRRRARRATAAALALAAALLTAGCGASDGTAAGGPKATAPAEGFPVTVDNCGVRTTYDRPPSRVVTIHQHPAELMLALGLKDRMVGTAFPDSAVLPELREDYAAIPELSEREPSFEKVLEAEPDFVYGGYASAFDENAGRSARRSPTPASTPTSTASTAAASG